jgi:hypothetical protein
VTPRYHNIIKAAIRLINSILRGINGVVEVWVTGEGTGVYIFFGESAADDECILESRSVSVYMSSRVPDEGTYTNNIPLAFAAK